MHTCSLIYVGENKISKGKKLFQNSNAEVTRIFVLSFVCVDCTIIKHLYQNMAQAWPELIELGVPRMKGQFLDYGPMSDFN